MHLYVYFLHYHSKVEIFKKMFLKEVSYAYKAAFIWSKIKKRKNWKYYYNSN